MLLHTGLTNYLYYYYDYYDYYCYCILKNDLYWTGALSAIKRNDIVETASKVIGSITGTIILVHPEKLSNPEKLRILYTLKN